MQSKLVTIMAISFPRKKGKNEEGGKERAEEKRQKVPEESTGKNGQRLNQR